MVDEISSYLRHRTQAPNRWIQYFRRALEDRLLIPIIPADAKVAIRDPKDEHVVAAALSTGCSHLVSGDQDLLTLGQIDQAQIISVKEFLSLHDS